MISAARRMKTILVLASILLLVICGRLRFFKLIDCPSMSGGDYRVLEMLSHANKVIEMGEPKAYRFLLSEASCPIRNAGSLHQEKVALICMLVYPPEDGDVLRGFSIGSDNLPHASMPAKEWPRFPLVISRGIPFLMVYDFNLGGPVEEASHYLDYCRKTGAFRTATYQVPTAREAEAALKLLFCSSRWEAVDWQNAGDRCSEKEVMQRLRTQAEGLPR